MCSNPLPPSAGTVTVDCTAGTPFSLTSGPEAEVPKFTLSCTSTGGPVREFNCTSPDGGNIAGVASLRTPADATVRDQGLYDHSVTVTGNYPGDYTCQVTALRTSELEELVGVWLTLVGCVSYHVTVGRPYVCSGNISFREQPCTCQGIYSKRDTPL